MNLDAVQAVLDQRGYLRVQPPPYDQTEAAVERTLRSFHATCSALGLQVESLPGRVLIAYPLGTDAATLDRIHREATAQFN